MKPIYVAVFIFLVNILHAQQPFQGSILYNLHADMEKNDAEILVQFGVNKIKVQFKEKNHYDNTFLIVDLDSGKVFAVDSASKTYRSQKLAEINLADVSPAQKTIAGYATSPVNTTGNGITALLSGLFAGKITYYVANDLYYPLPQKYSTAPQLLMINNNHIVLGLTIVATSPKDFSRDTTAVMSITAEAKKVDPQVLDIAGFSIPKDFTLRSLRDYSVTDTAYVTTDSTTMMIDSLPAKPNVKKNLKPLPKNNPSTPKKTTATKTEAIKPKKTQTKS